MPAGRQERSKIVALGSSEVGTCQNHSKPKVGIRLHHLKPPNDGVSPPITRAFDLSRSGPTGTDASTADGSVEANIRRGSVHVDLSHGYIQRRYQRVETCTINSASMR